MEFPAEFYSQYIERRKSDLKILEQAFEENRIGDFKRIGHQLKGNAPSFGFDDLAELAKQMEKLNAEDLRTDGHEIIDHFKKWIEDQMCRRSK
jgi:HPt (histidine-containing phosphotransfer) domain-containing protein